MSLSHAARPLDHVLQDASTPAALRERLERAAEIRRYASEVLDLPDNGSYRRYADLQRAYAVWNVFATPELSMQAREWCFPIVGCVSYRGYFSQSAAESAAERLRAGGDDVFVGGVAAYSTLGWFDDPLLNTFIRWPDVDLARLIFHELAHQRVYVDSDTEFNESFAMTVEIEGVRRWLSEHGSAQAREEFSSAQRRQQEFTELVLRYRDALDRLFRSEASSEQKRTEKQGLIAALHTDYLKLRNEDWGGYRGYDAWFGQEINNAVLASIGIYNRHVTAFRAVLARCGDALPCFYAAARELARLPAAERAQRLQRLGLPQSDAESSTMQAYPDSKS